MIEGIRAFAEVFGFGIIFLIIPLVFLLCLLGMIIKSAWVRVPVALLIWATMLSELGSVCSPTAWSSQQFISKRNLERIYPALVAYKNDHGNVFPERLSQLVPDYLPFWHICFFRTRPGLQPGRNATDVDQRGLFEYFGGKKGGMLAANRQMIEEHGWVMRWFRKPGRVVLDTNGKIESLPEEEYQRRLAKGQ